MTYKQISELASNTFKTVTENWQFEELELLA